MADHKNGVTLLRSFSAFPDGWPGGGLLLQRVAVGFPLVYWGAMDVAAGRFSALPDLAAAAAGILLICGFFTSVAGAAIVLAEIWMFFSPGVEDHSALWIRLLLAALGASAAMLGPGAWSVDAKRFGRKVFEISESPRPDE
jgi:uncharacterized membrane protein YphA (DoxX/SURF4 family)